MRSNTPSDEGRRTTISGIFRASSSGASRPQSLRESRMAYRASYGGGDVIAERPPSRESARPGSRESHKENMAPPDAEPYEKYRREIESLKAEVSTLLYRIQTSDQEKEIALSTQSNKVEQARRREQDEAHQRQLAEQAQAKAAEQVEAIKEEMEHMKTAAEEEKRGLERRVRNAEDEARLAQEQLEDLSSAKEDAARMADKKVNDLQMQLASIQGSVQESSETAQAKDTMVQQLQSQLATKDTQIADLEADVLRLKAQSGDAETMAIIKSELSEQVSHIRSLEATNRDQLSELRHLRAVHRATEVVEEEKRSLMRKLEAAEDLRLELSEVKMQRQRLEDERLSWAAYFKNAADGPSDAEFDSPESMARALTEERLTSASHVDQIGALRADIISLQDTIQSLTREKGDLKTQLEETKASAQASSTDRALLRLERQRSLAVKEVEYLRAQLKTFDVEDETMEPEKYDEARVNRVLELETIVDNYRKEVEKLHAEMKEDKPAPSTPQPMAGSKRSRAEDDEFQEQLGQLTRKKRKLEEELSSMHTKVALLEKDLSASKDQLAAAKQHNQTRVLSLRSNPTSDYEAIKRSTLEALQKENDELLATLKSKGKNSNIAYIPESVLAAMERQVDAAKAETASAQKSARRLKEVWGSKSQEFKEAIFSTLGWTVTFIPNGKMRVESTFFPSQTDENENSIVFDGERGTMKVGGGPKSAFARRIGDQIGFWVREKGCIPGFLAALTLEFYEEHTRTTKG